MASRIILVLVLITVLLVPAAFPQQPPLQKIGINYPARSGGSWPLFLAKEGGYYQKYGLDVSLVFGAGNVGVAMITGGELELMGARGDTMQAILSGIADAGAMIEFKPKSVKITADQGIRPLSLSTAPFPAFPTDMQAQFMAMLSMADGTSLLTETIFENRYMHVPELHRMGADIEVRGRSAVVRGVAKLIGAPVMATDLRASMSLVIAGLAAEGETQVHRVYHLDRGYERLEEKLQAVGADVERASDG